MDGVTADDVSHNSAISLYKEGFVAQPQGDKVDTDEDMDDDVHEHELHAVDGEDDYHSSLFSRIQ